MINAHTSVTTFIYIYLFIHFLYTDNQIMHKNNRHIKNDMTVMIMLSELTTHELIKYLLCAGIILLADNVLASDGRKDY